MKVPLAIAAMAALVTTATPVSAQTWSGWWDGPAAGAFAQSPRSPAAHRGAVLRTPQYLRRYSDDPAYDVFDTQGNYIGSDPDPFIRNDLMRAPPLRDDN